MLNKEEIEKALEANEEIITYKADKDFRGLTNTEKTLLENNMKIKDYIQKLEISNAELDKENNRLEKIEFGRDEANNKIKKIKDKMQILKKELKRDEHKVYVNDVNEILEIIGG